MKRFFTFLILLALVGGAAAKEEEVDIEEFFAAIRLSMPPLPDPLGIDIETPNDEVLAIIVNPALGTPRQWVVRITEKEGLPFVTAYSQHYEIDVPEQKVSLITTHSSRPIDQELFRRLARLDLFTKKLSVKPRGLVVDGKTVSIHRKSSREENSWRYKSIGRPTEEYKSVVEKIVSFLEAVQLPHDEFVKDLDRAIFSLDYEAGRLEPPPKP